MSRELNKKKCVPCEGGVQPFSVDKINGFKTKISPEWEIVDNKRIKKEFPFDNFVQGMEFAGKVAALAEEEQHHPDLCIHYSGVDVNFTTHAIGGLSENDFIMAAKVDEI